MNHLLRSTENLADIRNRLNKMKGGLLPIAEKKFETDLTEAVNNAANALEDYTNWIELNLGRMNKVFSIGRDNYIYYLRNIALMTYTPEELLLMEKASGTARFHLMCLNENETQDFPS